jgi:hypothetical protein
MPSSDEIARMNTEIERLRGLDPHQVRLQWRNRFGRMAPKSLSKSLLVRVLIYRVQADLLGDLEPEVLRVLERYAARDAGLRGRGRPSARPIVDGPRIKPGSVLVREVAGRIHRVMALEEGYAWEGKTYRSLSEVARAITGTQWNGRRFFGLGRQKAKAGAARVRTSRASDGAGEEVRP